MSGQARPAAQRPKPLALIDPFADWVDRTRSSTAERDGVRLHVWHDAGIWLFEVYDPQQPGTSVCGGMVWYTRADAKGRATREAAWLLRRRHRSPAHDRSDEA